MSVFLSNVMTVLGFAVPLAALTEALVQIVKRQVVKTQLTPAQDEQIALGIAVVLCMTPLLPLTYPIYITIVVKLLVAAVISRGSNIVHDLISVLAVFAKAARDGAKS